MKIENKNNLLLILKYSMRLYKRQNYLFILVCEWFRRSFAVLAGVDGSSQLTASQRCDSLNSPYA